MVKSVELGLWGPLSIDNTRLQDLLSARLRLFVVSVTLHPSTWKLVEH